MEGLQLLAISLSVLFAVAMIFTILLWCRSWRKEEREQNDRQIKALRGAIRKLNESVRLLDHTVASLQTADAHTSEQLEDLRSAVVRLRSIRFEPSSGAPPSPASAEPAATAGSEADTPEPESVSAEEPDSDGYRAVSGLLKQGKSSIEVARELDIGVAEVRMIARMHASGDTPTPDSEEMFKRG